MCPAHLVDLETSDGVRIAGRYWKSAASTGIPGEPPGSFRPLAYVLAHGFTGSAGSPRMSAVAVRLASRGNAVLAFDARGHGRSGGHSTLGDDEIHDVASAVTSMREREPGRAVVLVGWSMGGSVVLRHAGLGGDADAVVAISSPGFWWERGTRPMRLVHWAVMTPTGRMATRIARRTRIGPGWTADPEQPVDVVHAIAPRPVLLVHGDRDHYFPVRHAEAMADAAPTAQFWLEAGMGHGEHATEPALIDRIDDWAHQALALG